MVADLVVMYSFLRPLTRYLIPIIIIVIVEKGRPGERIYNCSASERPAKDEGSFRGISDIHTEGKSVRTMECTWGGLFLYAGQGRGTQFDTTYRTDGGTCRSIQRSSGRFYNKVVLLPYHLAC